MPEPKPILLMTRPEEASRRFVGSLSAGVRAGLEVVIAPLFRVIANAAQPDLSRYGGVIFSSSNGVRATPPLPGKAAFCVGVQTTALAQAAGWQAQCMGQTAADLIASLPQIQPALPLLHLRGEHSRGDIAENLCNAGLSCDEYEIYHTQTLPLSAEIRQQVSQVPTIAPVFSPRSATLFRDKFQGKETLYLVALSNAVAAELSDIPHQQLDVAPTPDAASVKPLVEALFQKLSRVERVPPAQ